jgi:xanthine dehydrogenase/oxidase
MSTDMYGMATLDACRQIWKRLEPIRDALGPSATLKELASRAFMERLDLSAHGFFTVPNERCGFDWGKEKPEGFPESAPANSWKGNPFNYFTQGVAVAEVEIDILTGNHRTLRAGESVVKLTQPRCQFASSHLCLLGPLDVLVDVGSSINPAVRLGRYRSHKM